MFAAFFGLVGTHNHLVASCVSESVYSTLYLYVFIMQAAPEEDRVLYKDTLDHINNESMILSYTPMGEDETLKDKHILLVGDPR